MRSIPILSLKGGTGKSTVAAHLGLAVRDRGFRVGFLDSDITGPNLPSALGIAEPFPYVGLDTAREKMLPVRMNGYEIFSLAFRFGKAAVLWKGGESEVTAFGKTFKLDGTGRYQLVRQMLTNVEFSPNLDYLLVDCPPQSGDEVLSLFAYIRDLWGVILVCQPTNLAVQDIERTLNMVDVKRLPLLGMVGNMIYAVAPKSKEVFSPFLDAGIDLEGFCKQKGVPYLGSVPFTPDREVHQAVFKELAQRVLEQEPVKIWEKSFKKKLEQAALRGIVKGLFARKEN